jgi:hypothetical protein
MKKFLFSCILSFSFLQAESIILKSGKVIEGQIVSQTSDSLTYELDGKKYNLPKSVIFKVLYKASIEEKRKIANQALEFSKKEINKDKSKDQKEIEEYRRLEEERIRELERTLEEMKIAKQQKDQEDTTVLKARIAQLETRLAEVETFLNLNTDWKEKYLAKRNFWSVVWRSALLPGWGHSYIDENFVSSFYLTTFLFSVGGVVGANSAQRLAESSYNTKVRDVLIIRPLITSYILSTTVTDTSLPQLETSRNLLSQYTDLQRLNDVKKVQSSLDNTKKNTATAKNFLIGLYLIQLTHAFISGILWEKAQVVPQLEEKKISTSLDILPDFRSNSYLERGGFQVNWSINFRY